jgi:proteasome lid subunit RPN8/RPN11
MDVEVTSGVLATLHEEAARAMPEECCGILLGAGNTIGQVMPAKNIAAEPCLRFEIDPAVLLAAHKAARTGGHQVLGYYHSHPRGHPVPSATDCEHSTGDLRIWAIIAAGQVAFFRDSGNGFQPLNFDLVDDRPRDPARYR